MLTEIAVDPASIATVAVTGQTLTLSEVVAVARHRARIRLDPQAARRVAQSRTTVESLVQSGQKVYGLTTGFGSLRDVAIPASEVRLLQHNLVRSHAAGVGEPLGEDIVRAMMLLRLNTLAAGYSGIRVETLERIVTLLNADVFPWVPSRGSVGASGDLAPLAHLALVVIGDAAGRICSQDAPSAPLRQGSYRDRPRFEHFVDLSPGVLEHACGLEAYELDAKEGLALTNGTQLMTALGALALFDVLTAFEASVAGAAASLEAIKGCMRAFDPRVAQLRRMVEQGQVAAWLNLLMGGSTIISGRAYLPYLNRVRSHITGVMASGPPHSVADTLTAAEAQCTIALDVAGRGESPGDNVREISRLLAQAMGEMASTGMDRERAILAPALAAVEAVAPSSPRVQDDYSFRCTPQVLGSALWVVRTALQRISNELNAVTDNPLVFPGELGENSVVSGGNFHGQPISMAMDMAAMAASEIASISERRSAKLLDSTFNYGLPAHLVPRSGLNSGFMLAQYTAAALVSESKLLSHPASVDSIPTCESTEDHVSMGPLAGLKLHRVVENTEHVVAIELLLACQALDMWQPLRPGRGVEAVRRLVRESGIPFVEHDVPLYPLMEGCVALIRNRSIHYALQRTMS
ncbi:aromatic amino acid lyase [Candidatus Fermentibacteria bacterium]|nr:aromatic amino acid lyase [Candidatus Fermentibacteria bacterium]